MGARQNHRGHHEIGGSIGEPRHVANLQVPRGVQPLGQHGGFVHAGRETGELGVQLALKSAGWAGFIPVHNKKCRLTRFNYK